MVFGGESSASKVKSSNHDLSGLQGGLYYLLIEERMGLLKTESGFWFLPNRNSFSDNQEQECFSAIFAQIKFGNIKWSPHKLPE